MEACLGYSAQGNGNRDADSTQKKTVAGEYSDLIEYMKTYNCEITEDLLERISKRNSNSNGITDPKIVMMTALFEKFCSAGYEVHKVTPYMSVNYPYCRWIVEYESLYEYNHYGESEHVLTMCKPPQVFPVYVPHNTLSFRGKRLMQFGVKHCACVKPTEQFVSGFNMIHNTYALYDMSFASPLRRECIDYRKFSEVIEESFTQSCLERAPLIVPLQHVPTKDCEKNFLNFEERREVSIALQKLAKKPDLQMNILCVFQDYDKANCGTVTREQFLKALHMRGMADLVSTNEFEVICKCFGFERGMRDEVDYRSFIKALDVLYATDKYTPI